MKLQDLRLLILEDQASYARLIKIILEDIGIQHFCLVSSYEEAMKAFTEFNPDACFLDIELEKGQKNGLDVAHAIREDDQDIPIVFLTSHYEEAYYEEVRPIHPAGFMSKELSRLRLLQRLESLLFIIEKQQDKEKITPKQNVIPLFNASQIFFKIGDTYKALEVDNISFFFAENKLTYAHVGNRNYPTSVQLKVLEEELAPKFLRCHKKFLVNVNSIESIMTKEDKIKIGKELLPIGYAYRKGFLEKLNLLK